jgi:hypothetical protein
LPNTHHRGVWVCVSVERGRKRKKIDKEIVGGREKIIKKKSYPFIYSVSLYLGRHSR